MLMIIGLQLHVKGIVAVIGFHTENKKRAGTYPSINKVTV
jgi:hypothetical protein